VKHQGPELEAFYAQRHGPHRLGGAVCRTFAFGEGQARRYSFSITVRSRLLPRKAAHEKAAARPVKSLENLGRAAARHSAPLPEPGRIIP
jgi:hypothetical protein